MSDFSISFSRALVPEEAAAELAAAVEADFRGPASVAGGLLFATAAAGGQGAQVGRLLGQRWAGAALVGTSFEGLISDGCIVRDEPALGLLAWRSNDREPAALAFEPMDCAPERVADAILSAVGEDALGSDDLVLLFPDAHAVPAVAPMLETLSELLGAPTMAGAAATGIDGASPGVFVTHDSWHGEGGLVALVVPNAGEPNRSELVQVAGASRIAGPWLEVSECRSRWIDRLEGDRALLRVRQQLGLDGTAPLAAQLERLLVRVRRRAGRDLEAAAEGHDDERYIVGLDEGRGAFSMPIEIERGDRIALAWPDAERARESLRRSLDALPDAGGLLQFACRARDADLHGDDDLESAWVAAHAGSRGILGTVAPFQLGPGPNGGSQARMLVHSSVLTSLGAPKPEK